MCNKETSEKLRELILNARSPIVLRKFHTNWKFRNKSLEDWCKLYDESNNSAEIEFEKMSKESNTIYPQWERQHSKVNMTMKTFLEQANIETDFWSALNYKTPDEIPEPCKCDIDFSCFGFPNIMDDYARFWLSTPNANTPCHKDTYGCNVVVQAFGSKLWLLFPPDTALTTTRIPYEESSIYCEENFYAPTATQVKELKKFENDAYICLLEAGDVLIVPHLWWHFVETKTNSLSINCWIPLNIDKYAELEECVVKYIIESIAKNENPAYVHHILNPNQTELTTESDTLLLLSFLAHKIDSTEPRNMVDSKDNVVIHQPYQYLNEQQLKDILNEFENAELLKKSSPAEYNTLIVNNSKRYKTTENINLHGQSTFGVKDALINSICSGNVVKEIINEFRKRLPNKHV